MKRILALVFLSLILSAVAEPALDPKNPCAVPEPNTPKLYKDQFDGVTPRPSAFNCMPEMAGGTGKGLNVKIGFAGVMAYWYCPNATPVTEYRPNWGAATWAAVKAGALKPDTLLSDQSLTPIWCPHVNEMYAGVPKIAPPPPPPAAWVTAGTSVYSTVNGRLGVYSGRTTIGLSCDCTKPVLIVGTVVYCPFTGAAPGMVASCRKYP